MIDFRLFILISIIVVSFEFWNHADSQKNEEPVGTQQACLKGANQCDLDTLSLDRMNVDVDQVTVSGFSAGASMATQFHIAHSSRISGIAMFGQVFYRCGWKSKYNFGSRCTTLGKELWPYPVNASINDVYQFSQDGLIDSFQNLKNHRVFIWAADNDEYIPLEMAKKNVNFYSEFIADVKNNLKLEVFHASHAFPTINYGADCGTNAESMDYLGKCNYSGAYHSLNHLYKDLIDPNDTLLSTSSGILSLYNQSEFYPQGDIKEVAMGNAGFVYIPSGCVDKQKKCRLHINFHGCYEWRLDKAERYIKNNGFLPVADLNDIVLLFPLTTQVPANMKGCWDFFSYTGENFGTKQGSQIKVVKSILDRIIFGKEPEQQPHPEISR